MKAYGEPGVEADANARKQREHQRIEDRRARKAERQRARRSVRETLAHVTHVGDVEGRG